MQNFKFLTALSITMLILQGLYAQYQGQVNFNPADVNTEQTDGWDVATIPGCYMETATGTPYLPVKHLHIAIPEDKTVVSIEIINIQQQELTGTYKIMPTQPEQIPGEPEPEFVVPNPDIYGVNAQYPVEYIYNTTSGFMSGVHIAGILYYPLTYNPVTKKLFLTTHLEYRLVYVNQDNSPVKPRRMINSTYLKTKEKLESFVENQTDIDNYFQLEKTDDFTGAAFAPTGFPNFNGQAVEYVIITNETLAEGFQEIADWKTRKGVPAVVRTVEWIYGYYPGVDRAEKVRNFIIDAYQNWGTQFFMLGGDSEVVPVRYAWISPFATVIEATGAFVPADMYFACLDGNWNADGDATFGEANWDRHNDGTFEQEQNQYANLDEVDRLPDVVIGRIPVEDYTDDQGEFAELNKYKTKFFEYIKTSQGNENNVLLFSSMGSINQIQGAFPSSVNYTTRYNTGGYDNMDVLDEFNGNGPDNISHHIICGLGHGGPTNFAAANGTLNRTHMDNLINSDRSMIFCMNHCSTMPWNRNTVTEHFINAENGGVAITANTHIGVSSMVTTHDKPFIQYIYNNDNTIGEAFKYIKSLYEANSYYDYVPRILFFDHSLASDPEMPVWTNSPDPQNPLIVNVPANVYTGQQTIAVDIDNLAAGVEAVVCLFKEGEIYPRITVTGTGSTVTANLECTPDTPGDILVTVTAKNYLPVETTIAVTANTGTNLYVSDYAISGDEYIDAGETVQLNIELSNSGLTGTSGVYAVLSCDDEFITIQNNQSSFGTVAAGVSVWGQNSFIFNVDATLLQDEVATFSLTTYDAGNNTYLDELLLEIKSPAVEQRSKPIIHTTNGDLVIEKNETVKFDIELFNNSLSFVQNVNAVLSSQSDYVENIQQNQGAYSDIASYETNTNTNEYVFEVSSVYPGEPEPILFSLDAINSFGQQWQYTFDLLDKPDINGIVIDFRGKQTSIALFWTVYEDVLGYNIYRSNMENGQYIKINTQILPIAYFEDAGLQELTTYYYKVSIVSLTGNESELSQPKQAWTSLAFHPDWLPVTVVNEDHGYFWGAPNVYDLENNGEKEIFITSGRGDHAGNQGTIFGFRHDGEELYDIDDNPTSVSGFANIGISMTCTPAIGDIDNDGIVEIIVATRMGSPDEANKRKLFVYKNEDANNDGIPDLMWEKQIAYKNFNGVVLSDLDNNGTLEIIVPNQRGNKIEIFNSLGNNYPGWPVTTGENPIDKKAVSMPVAVDLDNDNTKEIVIGLEGGIYIWNSDGTNYLGQNPININIPAGGRLDCPVIAADIDNDGFFEILFMSIQNTTAYIYAIEANGDLVTGWDNNNHSIELSIESQNWAWPPAFACGDVDMDDNIEVVVADANTLKVWGNLGNLILDKNIPMLQCQYLQPLIADVDGDAAGECEIIIPSNNGVIHAYKLNGDPVLGWPLYLGSTSSIPLIDDIDNDSKNEIVAASGSEIYVWDTEGNSNLNQWGRFRLNSYNNGVLSDPCPYNPIPLVINSDQTWTSDVTLDRDLYVEDATLSIKSKVLFSSLAKIVIKPGAKLIIDGGTLTKACGEPWQGIQVWGNSTSHQSPDANGNYQHGYLKLINGATIENAIIAVDLWKPNDYSTTGGMVYANNAIFRNNTKSVHALHYHNFNPNLSTEEWNYFSNFKNCTFEITEDYPGDVTFYKHIDLAHVKGIDFQGCDFSLDENATNVSTWNHAIAGYDAKFRVSAICNSPVAPCPEEDYDKCTFTGFFSAISAVNDGSSAVTFNVTWAEFIDNVYGVKTREMDNATVLFSDFEIGHLWECGAGIYADNVTGFAFEENEFSKYSGGPVSDYFGIIINNSCAVNEVYKNTFNGLSYANFSDGKNWDGNDRYNGLAYYCNENSNNYADFYVNDFERENHSGIQTYQGNENYVAGNTFTQSGATWHFYNGGEHLVGYYHNPGNTPTLIEDIALNPINITNNCPSHYGNPSLKLVLTAQQKADAEQEYYNNLTDYNNVKTLYDSYVDGGNTEAEKLDIKTAQPADMWDLRAQLLGDSPHLSFDVLKEAADKTDVFTEAVIFDIMAANPDELKKDTMISYLENKEEPLPVYMTDILQQLAEGITYKTALQQQMAGYKHSYSRAAHDIIRSNLNDTVTDNNELRDWLDNLGGITSDRQIISSYISEGNFTDALALANMLPQLYKLEGNELTEHNYYMDMLNLHQTLFQQGRNTFQLNSTEKAGIDFIANNSKGVAGAQAKSILEAVYNEYYDDCPDADGTAGYKSSSVINPDALGKAYGLSISVKPNPARQWAAFDYTLPGSETKATITITNTTGSAVEILEVSGQQGQKLWDTRKVKPGIYLYTLKVAGFSKSGKIVISK